MKKNYWMLNFGSSASVKQLVKQGMLKEAIDILFKSTENPNLQNALLTIQGTLRHIQNQEIIGAISLTDALRERAKITDSVLKICDEILTGPSFGWLYLVGILAMISAGIYLWPRRNSIFPEGQIQSKETAVGLKKLRSDTVWHESNIVPTDTLNSNKKRRPFASNPNKSVDMSKTKQNHHTSVNSSNSVPEKTTSVAIFIEGQVIDSKGQGMAGVVVRSLLGDSAITTLNGNFLLQIRNPEAIPGSYVMLEFEKKQQELGSKLVAKNQGKFLYQVNK